MSYSNGSHYLGQLRFFRKVATREDRNVADYIATMDNHNRKVAMMRRDSWAIQKIHAEVKP